MIDLTAYAPADLQETFTGFTKPDEAGRVKADEVQAVVAMPEPVNGEGLKTWNISHTDGWTDDQRFIADLIDDVGAATCIDLDRVLVMGFAIGGFMASAVACEQPHRIALLATVAGLWNPPNCDTTERVPVIAFHGTDDQLLAYEGGVGARASETGIGEETSRGLVTVADQPGAKATAAAWADRNGCTGSPTIEAVTSVVARSSWSECTADVELYTIAGGGHTWPGSNGMANAEQFLGPVSQEIDANDVIWDFFVAHVPA